MTPIKKFIEEKALEENVTGQWHIQVPDSGIQRQATQKSPCPFRKPRRQIE
jgi:hypothetical protein